MATKLKNLKIKKVDFVDEGANPDADIKIKKNKGTADPAAPASDPDAEEAHPEPKKSLAKRLADFLADLMSTPEDLEQHLDKIEKSGATSFMDEFNRRSVEKIIDEMWNLSYALQHSWTSILYDEDLDSAAALAGMQQSLEEFQEVAKECVVNWAAGKSANIVSKSFDPTDADIKSMEAVVGRMTGIIEKSAHGSEGSETRIKATTSKGEEDMKIDKSKMTEAERAFLDSIEKRYGCEEAPEATAPTNPQEGVAKAAPKAPEASTPPTDAEDIYKGISAEVKAEIESLKKFKADAEDNAIRAVAKNYEIIGKKEEDLFPILKSLKATSEAAYDQMVSALDDAKATVEKSGAFTEIGKSGTGSAGAGAWDQAEAKASEIMKNRTGITHAQALQEVFAQDPEIARKCKEED